MKVVSRLDRGRLTCVTRACAGMRRLSTLGATRRRLSPGGVRSGAHPLVLWLLPRGADRAGEVKLQGPGPTGQGRSVCFGHREHQARPATSEAPCVPLLRYVVSHRIALHHLTSRHIRLGVAIHAVLLRQGEERSVTRGSGSCRPRDLAVRFTCR